VAPLLGFWTVTACTCRSAARATVTWSASAAAELAPTFEPETALTAPARHDDGGREARGGAVTVPRLEIQVW
jgi:hypothetical protein